MAFSSCTNVWHFQSFNLKPANAKKPNVKGVPPTNLKVAAILDKVNAVRQVFFFFKIFFILDCLFYYTKELRVYDMAHT